MSQLKKLLGKEDLREVLSLYSKQSWLIDREDGLMSLILNCDDSEQKRLIYSLLNDFHFLDEKVLNNYLNLIADYIISDSNFNQDTTQLAAITYDDEADSSQKILDYIKVPLYKQGWKRVKTVNRYGATIRNFNEGLNQIIFIDEFIGSGKTILGRIKQLQNDIKSDFEIKFCFIAGMDYSIRKLESLGFEVYCPLRLPKGISERWVENELENAILKMRELEGKLAPKINNFDLEKYSFGYNNAEALYSLEGCQGNTPNSVFPLFWWPSDFENIERKTILTRYERGLE
jgi:hypothetical protein